MVCWLALFLLAIDGLFPSLSPGTVIVSDFCTGTGAVYLYVLRYSTTVAALTSTGFHRSTSSDGREHPRALRCIWDHPLQKTVKLLHIVTALRILMFRKSSGTRQK